MDPSLARNPQLFHRFGDTDIFTPYSYRAMAGGGAGDDLAAGGEWLDDDALQTYSVRAGLDKWKDSLRKRVVMYKFEAAYGESDVVKAILETRGRSGGPGPRDKRARAAKEERAKKRRAWEERTGRSFVARQGRGGGSDDEDEDDDDLEGGTSTAGGATGTAVGAMIRLGPVAKTRNSTLKLHEHQTYLSLSRKKERAEHGLEDARPLTAEERQSLHRLEPLVRAEQAKYNEALRKWVESSRAPYRQLEQALKAVVDPYLASLRHKQKATYPQFYQHHIRSPMGDPSSTPLLPEPGFLGGVKAPNPSARTLQIPDLPFHVRKDVPVQKAVKESSASSSSFDSTQGLKDKDWIFEESEILVDLSILLTLADPVVAWKVPFTIRTIERSGKKVLIVHAPLLPPTLTYRQKADLYYQHVLPKELYHRPVEEGEEEAGRGGHEEGGGEGGADPCLALDAWQIAQLRVVVATERVAIQEIGGEGEGGYIASDAILGVEVDYAMEWSEEEEPQPQGLIKHMIYSWATCAAADKGAYVAKIDGKTSRLIKVIHKEYMGRALDPRASSDITCRLRYILGVLLGQAEGQFIVCHEPEKREMVIYRHVEGLEGNRADSLDLHAIIEASGQTDSNASSSWVRWIWPSQQDHIPGTFVPRQQ